MPQPAFPEKEKAWARLYRDEGLKFVRGVTTYVSGRIAKLSPDAVRLETPAAIVGVRGTTLAIRVDEK